MARSKKSNIQQNTSPQLLVVVEDQMMKSGGSPDSNFNHILVDQALSSIYRDPDVRQFQSRAVIAGMAAVQPSDAIEGMLTAQMLATHNAIMECYRRAALANQTFEGWQVALSQASKLVRSYASIVETLNRHRGKGQQRMSVEHFHFHQNGQTDSGAVGRADGRAGKEEEPSHATKALTYEPGVPLRSPYPERDALPIPSGEGEDSL